MSSRVAALAATLLMVVVVGAACGGDDRPQRPALDQIAPAVSALERELGGPQQYFEINATPQLVNLFVADAARTTVTPYVFVRGAVTPTGAPQEASGNSFAATALTFDPVTILGGVVDGLKDSDIVLFAIAGGPGGAVQYTATVRSAKGGTFDVTVAANGTVESAAVPTT